MDSRIFKKLWIAQKLSERFTVILLNDSNDNLNALDHHLGSAVAMEIRISKPINLFVDTIPVKRMSRLSQNCARLCLNTVTVTKTLKNAAISYNA